MKACLHAFAAVAGICACDEKSGNSGGSMGPSQKRQPPTPAGDVSANPRPSATP